MCDSQVYLKCARVAYGVGPGPWGMELQGFLHQAVHFVMPVK